MKSKLPGWLRWAKPFLIAAIDPIIRGRILHEPEETLAAKAAEAGVTALQYRAVEAMQSDGVDAALAQL